MIALPPVLARYVAAKNAHDIDALLACFAPGARVRDEGEDLVGHDAVRAWLEKTSAKYRVTLEPLGYAENGDRLELTAKVTGTFKGSPITLRFDFGLDASGQIESLAIG